jgi:hypothetical protein
MPNDTLKKWEFKWQMLSILEYVVFFSNTSSICLIFKEKESAMVWI